MKTLFATIAIAILATSAQASDVKVYAKAKQEMKMAGAHKTGVSWHTVHGRAESGSKTKGAAAHKTNGSDRVHENLIKKKDKDKVDKHKKKASKAERTKF